MYWVTNSDFFNNWAKQFLYLETFGSANDTYVYLCSAETTLNWQAKNVVAQNKVIAGEKIKQLFYTLYLSHSFEDFFFVLE